MPPLTGIDTLDAPHGDLSRRIQDQPVYRTLKVAKEGRDLFLVGTDPVGAAYAFSTALSLPVALDGLTPQLTAAIDGDPATKATP